MTEAQLPTGAGYHWSDAQRQAAADAVLDAREAATLAEAEAQFPHEPADLSGIRPWSEEAPGVLVAVRQAELDAMG